ncbi:hypothetical protein M407DRAFT_17259 [Tulasnella calospora MUT 4182]|uniref:Caspase family p20 domain-containing protein n=1 Tax=Tulasnella calospora MUT 4182 TaxID=1051891 RepID=A0A0C3MJW1_9AGAM|nr:hypothetical protein M407DRAFT_17259 [Tulasnella calospora MUT 4182]
MRLALTSLPALTFMYGTNFSPHSFISKKKRQECQQSRVPNRKALLIGIRYKDALSYRNDPVDLREVPHQEVQTWKGILTDYFSYENDDVTCMLDDEGNQKGNLWPCHQNILAQIEALVDDIRPGDRRFLFIAAHGGQLRYEKDSTELNGNVFYTVECGGKTLLKITNDNLRHILVNRVPKGAKLTVVFELCNSGTLLDLPFRIDPDPDSDKGATLSPARNPAKDVEGNILCLSACENWQKAHHWESPLTKEQGIITSIVEETLRKNGYKGREHRLNLVQLHRELLKPPDSSSQTGLSEAVQTPVVTIGKRIPADQLGKLSFRP